MLFVLTLLVLFVSSCGFKLLFSVLSFHPERAPLAFRRVGLLGINSLFLFIQESFNLSFIFKDSFPRYRLLGWLFYSFSALNMSSHYLLAFMISKEKLAVNLTEDYLWLMSHLSLAAFRTLPLAFNSLIITCLSEELEVHWVSWTHTLLPFIKFAKFLAIITSNSLSAPFSLSALLLGILLYTCWYARCSLRLYSFFKFIFSLCSSDSVISIDLP